MNPEPFSLTSDSKIVQFYFYPASREKVRFGCDWKKFLNHFTSIFPMVTTKKKTPVSGVII
jgi:hypothetical protein